MRENGREMFAIVEKNEEAKKNYEKNEINDDDGNDDHGVAVTATMTATATEVRDDSSSKQRNRMIHEENRVADGF